MIVSNTSSVRPPSSSSSTTAVAGTAAVGVPDAVLRRLEVPGGAGGVTDRSRGSVEGGVSVGCRSGISLYVISVNAVEDGTK